MFSIFVEKEFCFFILISYTLASVTSDGFKDDSVGREAHSEREGLWFGPRLGKRSRQTANYDNRQTFQRLLEAADVLKFLYDRLPYEMQVEEPLKAKQVYASKLSRDMESSPDKRTYDNVEFTPRLGRRIPDIMPVTTAEDDMFQSDPVMVNPLTNLFSPRLGRSVQFSPRLGRELNYDFLLKVVVEIKSYVLLAAHAEDFRDIAKKIVPETLANKLARLASDISVKKNTPDEDEETDYYYESADEKVIEDTKEDGENEDNIKNLKRSKENMYVNEGKTRVDFDELVERVKDRLARELSHKLKKNFLNPTQSIYNNVEIKKDNLIQTTDKDINDGRYIQNNFENKKTYGYNYPEDKHPPKQITKNVNSHIKTNYQNLENKMPPSKNIEQEHESLEDNKNTYHEENTHEKYKGVLTNYQTANAYKIKNSEEKEYIDEETQSNDMNHGEDNDFFHSQDNKALTYNVEDRPKRKPNKELNTKYKNVNDDFPKYTQKHKSEINKYDGLVDASNNGNEPSLFEEFDLSPKKNNDSYEDYVIPKVENKYASDETSAPIKKYRPRKIQISKNQFNIENSRFKVQNNDNLQIMKPLKNKKQYVQINENMKAFEDYAEIIDKSQEIKAKTESLLFNYDDEEPKTTKENRPKYKKISSVTATQKSKAKGTMIPTREYFKMSSPNYYISLPTVVEKYDSNEPLPEKDREREVIKHFVNPPASINKKVKLT